ncbi:CRAL-TRIO domain and GOLD domain-containing protein [Strongyloides ratti]|uniref:CRAL-TRIO domain and GOLD domain-containing protein n=1 Tax=Strongyloides ratti TaxID=34506 RepID=A0A090L0G4_STRRB|nr:CRAL-TRIO domain and GOLD domain-containing protein [Strongyloides ratti]CEF63240.1 CRAL-TRIO domain and GOLD domain-containing protein [Strongyloides ratti]
MPPNQEGITPKINMSNSKRILPVPFDDETLNHAKLLRKKFNSFLPEDINTDFHMARWYRMYKGNEETMEIKLKEYIRHRKSFNYEVWDKFSISKLDQTDYSGDVAVFLQRMEGTDLKEIIKTVPYYHILHSYFLLQECMQRAILLKEKETGRQSAAIIILDLHGINLGDFINPLSNPTKLARIVVKIWSDYFTENMVKLILVRPPGILSVMWQLAKYILDEKTSSQIAFVQKYEELKDYVDESVIPKMFGGTRVDNTGWSETPESCVKAARKVTQDLYYNPEKIYKKYGIEKIPSLKSISIKNKHTETVIIKGNVGQKIIWHFMTSNELVFDVLIKENGQSHLNEDIPIIPGVYGTCLKLPEQGVIEVEKSGEYHFRWINLHGGWLAAKVHYAIVVI